MKIVNPFDGSKAKAGDRVYSLQSGWGTVRRVLPDDSYPISVDFDEYEDDILCFTTDGKDGVGDAYPDLYYGPPEIIGPPKPKRTVKKEVRGWANVYPKGRASGLYSSKESADYGADSGRIACVELTGTYEVEED